MNDNRVSISTELDNGGIEKGAREIKGELGGIEGAVNDLRDALRSAFSGDFDKSIANANARVNELQRQLATVSVALKDAIADGDDVAAEKYGNQKIRIYDQLEAARERLAIAVRSSAEKEAATERNVAKRAADAKIKEEKRATLAKQKEAEKQRAAAMRPLVRFGNRFKEIVSGALVFNLLSAGLRAVTTYFGAALKSNKEFTASFAKLKGALLTAFQPIYEVVVPALITLMNILTAVVQVLGHVFSVLGGKSDQQMASNAAALNKQTKAISGAGSAAKKASKYLAGFDEIQKASGQDTSGGGGGSSGGISADFSDFNTADYKAKIDELTTYVSMSLLALGAILAFSGANIPLGIALMAMGAIGLATAIATNWDAVKNALSGSIGGIVALISGAFLAIGAVLAFASPSTRALGIGMMAVGAVGMATTIVANWNSIVTALQGPVGKITALVSGAVLAIGAILAFASPTTLGLGIGLIAAGAVGLGTTVALNWETIKQKLQGPIGKVVALLSASLLVLGAILAFACPATLALGIGLLAVGAAGLATTATLNWDVVKQKITAVFAGILSILSGAGIILGVLLCLSGAGLGLGLALIFAGLKGTTAAWNLSSNPVTNFVKNLANKLIEIINKVISAVNSIFNIKFSGLTIGGVQVIPSFSKRLVNLPQIPALAQGAVLPPNKPFMAMVGDQRHGKNIEAPLTTIQEAVALVMGDQLATMMAGFEALLEENRLLREVVEGIEIGDEVLGSAVGRYNAKKSAMRGSAV